MGTSQGFGHEIVIDYNKRFIIYTILYLASLNINGNKEGQMPPIYIFRIR